MREDENEGDIPLLPLHFRISTSSSKCVFCETGFGAAPLDFPMRPHIQSGNTIECSVEGGQMDTLWLALHWGSPIGIGVFLVCLGAMIYLLSRADEVSKHTKAFVQEKGLDKKK